MKPRLRYVFRNLGPRWLTTGEGGLSLYVLHLLVDAWLERGRVGVMARFPDFAPEDALGALSRDRKIIRGLNEPRVSFAKRLNKWLDSHRINGNPYVLLEQIRAYFQTDMLVKTVDQRGNWYWINADGTYGYQLQAGMWNWDSTTDSNWSRFWVIIYPSKIWSVATQFNFGTDIVLGINGATPDVIAGLRYIVRQWKPANAVCEYIIAAFNDNSFPVGTQLGGSWGNYANNNVPRTRSRLSSARYIKP